MLDIWSGCNKFRGGTWPALYVFGSSIRLPRHRSGPWRRSAHCRFNKVKQPIHSLDSEHYAALLLFISPYSCYLQEYERLSAQNFSWSSGKPHTVETWRKGWSRTTKHWGSIQPRDRHITTSYLIFFAGSGPSWEFSSSNIKSALSISSQYKNEHNWAESTSHLGHGTGCWGFSAEPTRHAPCMQPAAHLPCHSLDGPRR